MNMTREEAIKSLKNIVEYWTYKPTEVEAAKMAIAALRPVSRDRIEKVWSGCEYCTGDVDDRPYLDSKRLYLDKNGILTDEIENIDILRLNFCPVCGKPLTDEAVDIMLKRMEALLND